VFRTFIENEQQLQEVLIDLLQTFPSGLLHPSSNKKCNSISPVSGKSSELSERASMFRLNEQLEQ
jgi:hypothetical protein